jgi:shikimate kinase
MKHILKKGAHMNISLIGMAGVGKSTVGKALARKLGVRFYDTDKIIEEKVGLRLQSIINDIGEQDFLLIEEDAVLNLDLSEPSVVAPGGSVVYCEKAMEFLQEAGVVVQLKAGIEDIKGWITNIQNRGIVRLKGKTIEELYAERSKLYEQYADLTVEIGKHRTVDEVVEEIIGKVY